MTTIFRNNAIIFLLLIFTSCQESTDSLNSKFLRKMWSVELKKLENDQGFELPSIDGNRVYFPNGPYIECRDIESGKSIWKYKIVGNQKDYHGTNFSFNNNLIVINELFSTVALNKYTGEFVWMAPDSGVQRGYGGINSIDEQFGYRHPFISDPRYFIQFDLLTGSTIKSIISDSGGVFSVVARNGSVYATTTKQLRDEAGNETWEFGTVSKFNAGSGTLEYRIRAEPRWKQNSPSYGYYIPTGTETFSFTVFSGDFGYYSFRDGTTIKFQPETGKVIWKFTLPITNFRADFPGAKSTFVDEEKGLVFVTGGRDSWFCLDMETGKQLYWKRLSEYDGMIFPSSYDGNRYVFKPHTYGQYEWYIIDITTGEVVEEFDIPDDSILSQDVKNGYVAAYGVGSFYVFKIVR